MSDIIEFTKNVKLISYYIEKYNTFNAQLEEALNEEKQDIVKLNNMNAAKKVILNHIQILSTKTFGSI